MDGDRRVATMDLLRRFGGDHKTLSANSLVFNSGPENFTENETSFSPKIQRFRALSGDLDGKTVDVSKLKKEKEKAENIYEPPLGMEKYEAVFVKQDRGKRNNSVLIPSLVVRPSGDKNEPTKPHGLMASNLSALSNHLAGRNSEHHVHFPADGVLHGQMEVRRQSLPQASPQESDDGSKSPANQPKRRESYVFHKEKEHFPSALNSTSHLIAELSKHMSVLYCILITIASASLSISSTLTHNMDSTISRWFDSAMLAVAIAWLIFAFAYLFRNPKKSVQKTSNIHIIGKPKYGRTGIQNVFRNRFVENEVDSGSFYLKMGATAFAVGSMIYACLELGVFVENIYCFSPVLGLYPSLFVIYVLLQLYFIFKNSQFKITGCRALSRFGLAHLVATDVCVWIRTLLDETIHEFAELKQKQIVKAGGNGTSGSYDFIVTEQEVRSTLETGHISEIELGEGTATNYQSLCANGDSMMHEMKEAASMFLYPCMIEYALITAGIIYIMWHSVGKHHPKPVDHEGHAVTKRHPRMFSVDCSHAANGLFAGVLLIVLTIVGLIFYFLYVNHESEDSEAMAGMCADILDVSLNSIGLLAVLYCAWQFISKLGRIEVHNANMELDDGLLILTMVGVYAYTIMNIIGSVEGESENFLSISGDILELIQTTLQTIFIFDASKRAVINPAPPRRGSDRRQSDAEKLAARALHFEKPGREMLTLLLAVNFGQWAIDIMCTLRAETNPVPKNFFGTQQWATMLHVTVPLVIFYRFHSTVCLFDIWKHAYKFHKAPRTIHPM